MASSHTPSAVDVAEYILGVRGLVRAEKLQKLVYYCQAWSMVWAEEPLFSSEVQAWVKGPVAPDLYKLHEHKFEVRTVGGVVANLTDRQREIIDAVLSYYGGRTSEWLIDLTHSEKPWIAARGDLPPEAHGTTENVITPEAMADYYENQPPGGPPDAAVDLSVIDLDRLLKAEAEVRRGEVVEWDEFERDLQDQAREVGRSASQRRA